MKQLIGSLEDERKQLLVRAREIKTAGLSCSSMTIAEQLRTRKHALSVNDLAEILQLDEETIRRHIRRGHIPHFKVGMTIRFDPSHLADWLEKTGINLDS